MLYLGPPPAYGSSCGAIALANFAGEKTELEGTASDRRLLPPKPVVDVPASDVRTLHAHMHVHVHVLLRHTIPDKAT